MRERVFFVLWFYLLFLTACAGRIVPGNGAQPGTVTVIVRTIEYDEKGLPLLRHVLPARPAAEGDHFTVVRLQDNRPLTSYDIAVTRNRPDFTRPFQAVYEWTGRGFMWGAEGTGAFARSQVFYDSSNRNEALVGITIMVTPLVAGTVGGFVIGLADGVRQAAVEINKAVMTGEHIISCTVYEYDTLNRLIHMRLMTPDFRQELTDTEFVYQGTGLDPVRTIARSRVERKERIVR